jgi:hypothetical protein
MIQLHSPGAIMETHQISSVRIPRVPAEIRTLELSNTSRKILSPASSVIFMGDLTTGRAMRR